MGVKTGRDYESEIKLLQDQVDALGRVVATRVPDSTPDEPRRSTYRVWHGGLCDCGKCGAPRT